MDKVIHVISGLSDGGAEGVLYRLCKYDSLNRHCVISLTDRGKYGDILLNQGVEVVSLKMKSNVFNFIIGILKLFFILRKNKGSIVQTWMYHADLIGGIAARLAGIDNIFWNIRHTTLERGKSKKTTIFIARLCAYLSGLVPKGIVCCAQEALQVHAELGYKNAKMSVIGNGYDLSIYHPSKKLSLSFRNELQLPSDKILLGMVGRFDSQKDHFGLLKALSIVKKVIPNFQFLLVGRELNHSNFNLTERIKKLDLESNILLLDQRTDIPSVMNGLDLHVLSSSFGEAFPNVLAEAMACGTPCVTTDVGDAAVIVGDTGWVVPPKNPQALASAILEAINEEKNNPQAWKLREHASRDRIVNNFGIERMISRYHQVWGNIK